MDTSLSYFWSQMSQNPLLFLALINRIEDRVDVEHHLRNRQIADLNGFAVAVGIAVGNGICIQRSLQGRRKIIDYGGA